jgi:histidine triad (HIT) family protein
MSDRTIFHKIRDREILSDIVYEDDDVFVIKDIRPKAPTHLLFIPKAFVASVAHAEGEHEDIPGMLIKKAKAFAKLHDIPGYKLTYHVGEEGGQEIMYIHLHFMAQKKWRE